MEGPCIQPRLPEGDTIDDNTPSLLGTVECEATVREPLEGEGGFANTARYISLIGALVFAAVTVARLAAAATIDVNAVAGEARAIIVVTGRLELADTEKFISAASRYESATVVLNSDGGNLVAGLQMGNVIRLRSFTTLVPDNVRCASACAFAWLGGTRRLMGAEARIGFHAAYTLDDGRPAESGVGNALVGAYLARIGLPDQAVVYITRAAPTEMTWLTMDEARAMGIDVELRPAVQASAPRRPAPPPSLPATVADGALARAAMEVANEYWARWSGRDDAALGYFATAYAGEVEFFGKPLRRDRVIDEKRRFMKRWPERIYTVRRGSTSTHCDSSASTCTVTGIVDWDCRSGEREARSIGAASFTFRVARSTRGVVIAGESGSLIQRRVGPLS